MICSQTQHDLHCHLLKANEDIKNSLPWKPLKRTYCYRSSGVWFSNKLFHIHYIRCSAMGALSGISSLLQIWMQLANLHGRHQSAIMRGVSSLRDFGWVIPCKTRLKREAAWIANRRSWQRKAKNISRNQNPTIPIILLNRKRRWLRQGCFLIPACTTLLLYCI